VFHCVSAAKGEKLWTFDAGGESIHASANVFGSGPQAKVVFGTDGADIFCLEAGDGKKVWEQKSGDRINGAPAVGWGLTFVSGCDAVLRAIDLTDGKEKFATDLPALSPASPALLDDRIVLGTDGGKIVCYSSDGQKQLWIYEEVKNDAMVYSSPAVAEGIVVAGARDRQVHAVHADSGKKAWTFMTRGEVDSSPAISGGRVFVGSKDKKLYVLDLKTGRNLGEFTAGRGIVASPAVARGVVVIGDTAGNVYCLETAGK
jgi:outer membrane protein assembly factor BamB